MESPLIGWSVKLSRAGNRRFDAPATTAPGCPSFPAGDVRMLATQGHLRPRNRPPSKPLHELSAVTAGLGTSAKRAARTADAQTSRTLATPQRSRPTLLYAIERLRLDAASNWAL